MPPGVVLDDGGLNQAHTLKSAFALFSLAIGEGLFLPVFSAEVLEPGFWPLLQWANVVGKSPCGPRFPCC